MFPEVNDRVSSLILINFNVKKILLGCNVHNNINQEEMLCQKHMVLLTLKPENMVTSLLPQNNMVNFHKNVIIYTLLGPTT